MHPGKAASRQALLLVLTALCNVYLPDFVFLEVVYVKIILAAALPHVARCGQAAYQLDNFAGSFAIFKSFPMFKTTSGPIYQEDDSYRNKSAQG